MSLILWTLGVLLITAVLVRLAALWLRWRGDRVITCPESKTVEGVELDASRAAFSGLTHREPRLELDECSRWPERRDCGQECLEQIASAPHHCLLTAILADWYLGKACVFCHRNFGEVIWHDHQPALRGPDGHLIEWSDVRPSELYNVLDTQDPVCWNCYVTETFRHEHPDLVIEREWSRDASGTYHVH